MSDIYFQKDYRQVVKKKSMQLKKQLGAAYSFQNIAEAIGVQRTYLSKVLNQQGHLSDDQLYMILEFLNFNEDESDFLVILHAYQRSGLARRKKVLKQKIEEYQKRFSKTEENLPSKVISPSDNSFSEYFLNPLMQLVHLLCSIDRFAKDSHLISEVLEIEKSEIDQVLQKLVSMEAVRIDQKGRLQMGQAHLFLSKDSPLIDAYHNLMRTYAVRKQHTLKKEEKYSLTMLFSCSLRRSQKIRRELVKLCQSLQEEAASDQNANEAFQLNIDLFPWTK